MPLPQSPSSPGEDQPLGAAVQGGPAANGGRQRTRRWVVSMCFVRKACIGSTLRVSWGLLEGKSSIDRSIRSTESIN
jgi:hypothetical protein